MKSQFNVLIQPHLTEKVVEAKEFYNQVTFKVATTANKIEIKRAVESIFDVKVKAVRVCNVKGKPKRQGKYEGRRSDWRKAIITLQEGHKIEYFEGA